MSQVSVKIAPVQCFPGMMAEVPCQVDSAIAKTEIYFGMAVGQLPAEIDVTPEVAMLAAGSVFKGIAIADTSRETDSNGGTYLPKTAVSVLKKGRIWVRSADAVDDVSKAVFVRNANGAAHPLTLGSFRATTATDYIDLTAIANVKWIAGTVIGSVNYGLLSINEG